MPTRESAPIGAPCWIELGSSDVGKSRAFYGELFGWTSEDPNPEMGGYFNFSKDGVLMAGGMSAQPGMPDTWSVYLNTADATKTAELAKAHGGQVHVEPMAVMDLGTMAFAADPAGAMIGFWQPGTHEGFGAFGEAGTPSWFELLTRDYDGVLAFYRDVFQWETQVEGDTEQFRYSTMVSAGEQFAGVMDASGLLPEGVPSHWSVYFGVADTDAALAKAVELGGAIVEPGVDTPYGRLGTATDATGCQFKVVAPDEMMPGES